MGNGGEMHRGIFPMIMIVWKDGATIAQQKDFPENIDKQTKMAKKLIRIFRDYGNFCGFFSDFNLTT